MKNLLKDISVLTDVSENTLKKFIPIITYCISHAVYESVCEKQDVVDIDLETGQLKIKIDSDGIKYRFVPSKDLEKLILQTVTTRNSPILNKLENNLQNKIDRSFKELL